MQVAEGIYQVQLPLPFPLKIVNCYVLRDASGWTIVDCGLNYPPGQVAWRAAFEKLGIDPREIRRIVLTHAHPDHFGMSGWLAAQSGAPVLLSSAEQAFAERNWRDGITAHVAISQFFNANGMPESLIDAMHHDLEALRQMALPLPPHMTTLVAGERLQIGEREFETVAAPGHSDGLLALYCRAERLMLCGDAVLMKITPNVGLWSSEGGDPLALFLDTLERLALLDVDLALPGHGPLITSFRSRLSELRAHHEERLAAMEQAAGSGANAFEISQAVFLLPELTTHQVRFAMAETMAHLEHLVSLGRLRRSGAIYCSC